MIKYPPPHDKIPLPHDYDAFPTFNVCRHADGSPDASARVCGIVSELESPVVRLTPVSAIFSCPLKAAALSGSSACAEHGVLGPDGSTSL